MVFISYEMLGPVLFLREHDIKGHDSLVRRVVVGDPPPLRTDVMDQREGPNPFIYDRDKFEWLVEVFNLC
jgi:hypothetical protein